MSRLGFDGRAVAIAASEVFVTAVQFEFRLLVMIENPYSPPVGVMARCAILSQRCFVFVVSLVAGITGGFGVLIRCGQMALLAGRGCMQADERKTGQVMVENHLLRPAGLLVTAIALLTLLAAVDVVAGVTGDALGGKILFIERATVTGGAA